MTRTLGSIVSWPILFLALALVGERAYAHGGVSLEDDLCIMRIGQYRAHFTGYQPRARASQEFCEDIPELGEAIIVLDFLDPALRNMDIDFEVITDPVTDMYFTFTGILKTGNHPHSG